MKLLALFMLMSFQVIASNKREPRLLNVFDGSWRVCQNQLDVYDNVYGTYHFGDFNVEVVDGFVEIGLIYDFYQCTKLNDSQYGFVEVIPFHDLSFTRWVYSYENNDLVQKSYILKKSRQHVVFTKDGTYVELAKTPIISEGKFLLTRIPLDQVLSSKERIELKLKGQVKTSIDLFPRSFDIITDEDGMEIDRGFSTGGLSRLHFMLYQQDFN